MIRLHRARHGEDEDGVGSGWENTLTDAVGAYLSYDAEACAAFCRAVLGTDYETPIAVDVQHSADEGTPDLAITLESGRLLLVENKVGSPLGDRQLERYLAIKSNGLDSYLAFFAKGHHNIAPEVLREPRYRHPAGTEHFLWRELWNMLPLPVDPKLGTSLLRVHIRDYLRVLGFAPTNLAEKWDLLFEDRLQPENRAVQVEFGDRLGDVRTGLRALGFAVSAVSHKGLEARPSQPAPYVFLKIYPVRAAVLACPEQARLVDGAAMIVAIVYEGGETPAHARLLAEHFAEPFEDEVGRKWCATAPQPFGGNKRTKVELATSLNWFLAEEAHIASRLGRSCLSMTRRLVEVAAVLE